MTMSNWQQRMANQDKWPNVPFVEQEERVSLTEAIGWAVLTVAFFGTMFAFLGA